VRGARHGRKLPRVIGSTEPQHEEEPLLKTIATLALLATTITPALSEEIRGEATFAWLAVGSTFTLGDGRPYFAGQFSGINVFKDDGGGALANSTIQCPATTTSASMRPATAP
jgi:hypothetical protein